MLTQSVEPFRRSLCKAGNLSFSVILLNKFIYSSEIFKRYFLKTIQKVAWKFHLNPPSRFEVITEKLKFVQNAIVDNGIHQ